MGFILFGALIFGVPDGGEMFTTPECTAKTLYAVWLGDEVHDTFLTAGVGRLVAEVYMYTWGILFIAIIFNVGLAIVESNYFVTTPTLEKDDDGRQSLVRHVSLKGAGDNEADISNDAGDLSDSELFESPVNMEWSLHQKEPSRNEPQMGMSGASDVVPHTVKNEYAAIAMSTVHRSRVTKVNTTPVYERR
eukprot:369514_1